MGRHYSLSDLFSSAPAEEPKQDEFIPTDVSTETLQETAPKEEEPAPSNPALSNLVSQERYYQSSDNLALGL
ncbi:hypothetical protein G9P44_004362 [Scheffersomyces stipitis]|nr:hypothetical protein G9P44_004362 [Scheffersomyces stipitis]